MALRRYLLLLMLQCMCQPSHNSDHYHLVTVVQYCSCNLKVKHQVLLLLQGVRDASSSSQRRNVLLVNECIHQVRKSNSGAASITDRAIVATM
jgi:hypothetical protein